MPILHKDGLHILAADIQYEGHIRVEGSCRSEMGQCLHHTFVATERGPNQVLTVASDHAPRNVWGIITSCKQSLNIFQARLHCLYCVAFVVAIVVEGDSPLLVN